MHIRGESSEPIGLCAQASASTSIHQGPRSTDEVAGKLVATFDRPRTIRAMVSSAECGSSAASEDGSAVSDWTASRAYALAGFAAVVGLGIWTRFHHLGMESLWYDEATTFYRARLPLAELIESSISKMHIPSYFMLIHYVMRLGDDEWMLRMPSAVFGVLKIALVTIAGGIVGGRRVGLVAGLLLVLSPTQLQYDQEARSYAAQTFGTCLALVGQLWLFTRPEAAVQCWSRQRALCSDRAVTAARWAWVAWMAGVVIALYMHNTSVLYMVASSAATLVFLIAEPRYRVRFFWHWVVANLIVLLVWSAWWPSLASQVGSSEFVRLDWTGVRSFRSLLDTTTLLLLGDYPPIKALVLGLAVAGAAALRRRPLMLASLLLLSLSAPLLFGLVSLYKPIFMLRLLTWGGPAFYVLSAHGVMLLPRVWQQALAVAVVAAVGLWGLHRNYYEREIKSGWRGAAQVMAKHHGEGVVTLLATGTDGRVIVYYRDRTTDPIDVPPWVSAKTQRKLVEARQALSSAREVVYMASTKRSRPKLLRSVIKGARLVGRARPNKIVIEHYVLKPRTGR
jgi:mannosyltransferase